jgi:hypothetical protein
MLKLGVSADEMKHIREKARSSIVRDSANKARQRDSETEARCTQGFAQHGQSLQ